MDLDRDKCVAFTGHRSCKEKELIRDLFASNIPIEESLELKITNAINCGYTTFLSGMAEGFDILAAECVLRLKRSNPSICLIAVIPFRSQPKKLSEVDKERYSKILDGCDSSIVLSEQYFLGCYNVRNNFLIDHSSLIITNFNGTKGGTEYTVKRAIKHSRKVVLVH